jgi:hypothetical protein
MKKYIPLLLVFLLSSCYSTQVFRYEPYGTPDITYEQDKKIAYQIEDSVIVSASGISYADSVFTVEAVVDNKSGSDVGFTPQSTYLFRYSNDTALDESKIYFAANKDEVLKSLNDDLQRQSDKLVAKAVLSIFLGAAFIAADIASYSNDDIADAMPAIGLSHDAAQIALDVSRTTNYDKIDQIQSQRQDILDQTSPEIRIEPHHYTYVTLKFKVPYSPYYKIYFDVNNRIFQFTFHGSKKYDV